ncbi:MAG: hypothetical protein ABR905_23195 [Terracidiphilus sp.]
MTTPSLTEKMLRNNDSGCNPRVIAILAVIFFCGVAFGALGMNLYLHRFLPTVKESYFAYQGRRVSMGQLQSDLDLNADQRETIKLILDDYAKYFLNLEDQRQTLYESGRLKILDVLDERQKAKFERMLHNERRQ